MVKLIEIGGIILFTVFMYSMYKLIMALSNEDRNNTNNNEEKNNNEETNLEKRLDSFMNTFKKNLKEEKEDEDEELKKAMLEIKNRIIKVKRENSSDKMIGQKIDDNIFKDKKTIKYIEYNTYNKPSIRYYSDIEVEKDSFGNHAIKTYYKDLIYEEFINKESFKLIYGEKKNMKEEIK